MTTLGKIPFTEKEKTIIGDFIHAIESDTLIISECESLVEVLANHNLITNKQEWFDKIKNKLSSQLYPPLPFNDGEQCGK